MDFGVTEVNSLHFNSSTAKEKKELTLPSGILLAVMPPLPGRQKLAAHGSGATANEAAAQQLRARLIGGLLVQTRIQRRVVLPCRFGPNDHPLSFDQLECARAALMPPQQFRSNIDNRPSFVHPSA